MASCWIGASSRPIADSTPGATGTSTLRMPSASARLRTSAFFSILSASSRRLSSCAAGWPISSISHSSFWSFASARAISLASADMVSGVAFIGFSGFPH